VIRTLGKKSFLERFLELQKQKNSILCIGLDPALPSQRKKDVIPQKYLLDTDENEARLNFCYDIIDKVSDYCIAVKPNEQYVRGFSKQQHQKLSRYARNAGLLSIYDCKLGDIGETAEACLFWINKWAYDAITLNAQPGNLEQGVAIAHGYDPPIGLLVLTLMSNPEAVKYFKQSMLATKPVFIAIAEDVKRFDADGCVVGATGHVTENDIRSIREVTGQDKVFLIPGIGAQRGDPEKVVREGGKNILVNVGRDVIYSSSPSEKAKEYNEMLNRLKAYASNEKFGGQHT